MPTKEEISALMKRFHESMPRTVMTKMERANLGICMVLRYLEGVGRPVSAADISRYMNVSTARMAVLLRTMSEKDFITKSEDSSDARKVQISLTDKGRAYIQTVKAELLDLMTEIVNRVGIERMEQFLEISKEINAAVSVKMAEKKNLD